jgi:hypothetical protein
MGPGHRPSEPPSPTTDWCGRWRSPRTRAVAGRGQVGAGMGLATGQQRATLLVTSVRCSRWRSPDGRTISGGDDGSVRYGTAPPGGTRPQIKPVGYSQWRSRRATRGQRGRRRVGRAWDLATGRQATLTGRRRCGRWRHLDGIRAVSSGEGRCGYGTWPPASVGHLVATAAGWSVAVRADGSRAAGGTVGASAGTPPRPAADRRRGVWSVAVTDGGRAVSGSGGTGRCGWTWPPAANPHRPHRLQCGRWRPPDAAAGSAGARTGR